MRVVLVGPESEGNVGFVARAMANFDVSELVLVNPRAKLGVESIRRSMHARNILDSARIVESLQEAIKEHFAVATTGIEASNSRRKAFTPEEFFNCVEHDNLALVFGRESSGLTNEEVEQCDATVRIETSQGYPVMNLSHAVAVILYEGYKKGQKYRHISKNQGFDSEVSVMDNTFKDVMHKLNYPEKEKEKRHLAGVFKNVFKRPLLFKEEFHLLIGFFKRIQKEIDSGA